MRSLAAITFWASLALIVYMYAGYPILLLMLGFVREFIGRRAARKNLTFHAHNGNNSS
jgi:hypothetical protein